MTEEVRYITYPDKDKNEAVSFDYDSLLKQLGAEIRETLAKTGGILELESFADDHVGQRAYYAEPINGIICDLFDVSTLEEHFSPKLFLELNEKKMQSICHLSGCGIMTGGEYQILKQHYSENGWTNILDGLAVVTIEPLTISKTVLGKVYGIPIFRCGQEAASGLAEYLIQKSFLPVTDSVQEYIQNLSQIRLYQQSGGNLIQPKQADETDLQNIKNYYLNKGNTTAMLKVYPPEIFEIQKGSWDLYRFVKCQKSSLRAAEGQWYEVSGLYARNPLEDIADDIEYVAIDFGTKSTVVAAFDSHSNINLIPVGMSADDIEKQYENPTIIRFVNIQQFLEDYRREEFRQDTKFNDVRVSYSALNHFEGTKTDKNQQTKMQQYLNQLKQWANNPNRKLEVVDGQGKRYQLSVDGQGGNTIDPIELYAYYIGLSINNMHQGKIYLKYYLSYSSTYSKVSREQIRASFEKGLLRSLPKEVRDMPGRKERFEVRLWYDEATAYAVCALNSYENYYRSLNKKGAFYLSDLENGMFYSIYDFGGGTLDFSFGIMKSDPECKTYTLLQSGGASDLGCEYILEELAFKIFYNNRKTLQARSIQCSRPSRFDQLQDDGGILADTSQARFNTNMLIAFLRQEWIGRKKDLVGSNDDHMDKELTFYTASNETVTLKIHLSKPPGFGNPAELLQPANVPIEAPSMLNFSAEPLQISNISTEVPLKPNLTPEDNAFEELSIGVDEVEQFFEKQVMKGIELFHAYYMELISRTELESEYHLKQKRCHIFLAGNASKSPRVKGCFQMYQEEHSDLMFCIHAALPTPWDEKQKSEHPGLAIPTAKSGVVHGLLMARPTAENICIVDHLPEVNFHYHIGSRSFARGADAAKGRFHLLLLKSEVPKAQSGQFRKLRKITRSMFELLYTDDDSYAMRSTEQAVSAGITAMVITIPQKYEGEYLYICAKDDSDVLAELGVSCTEQEVQMRSEVNIIGTIDLPERKFIPLHEKDDMPTPPVMTERPVVSYRLSISDSDGKTVWDASTSDFSFGTVKQEPVWTTESEKFIFCYRKDDGRDTMHQIPVPMNVPGPKDVFVFKIEQESEVCLGYRTSDRKCVEIFSADLKTGQLKITEQQKG